MGPPTDVDLEEAYRVVNAYRARYPHISAQWKTLDRLIHTLWGGGTAMEYGPLVFEKQKVWLPNEMYLRYPGLHRRFNEESGFTEWRYNGLYGGLLTENLVQALARIVVAWQLLQLAEKWRLALMVHDEGVFCVLEELAEECLREAEEIFGIPPSWCPDLPCAGEGIITKEYRKP
jgi:DNA polymerase